MDKINIIPDITIKLDDSIIIPGNCIVSTFCGKSCVVPIRDGYRHLAELKSVLYFEKYIRNMVDNYFNEIRSGIEFEEQVELSEDTSSLSTLREYLTSILSK